MYSSGQYYVLICWWRETSFQLIEFQWWFCTFLQLISSKRDFSQQEKEPMYFFGTVELMLEYANITIPQQECAKDLGVYVNRMLKWSTHVKSPTAEELSTSLKILYLGALYHISSKSSTSPMLFQYSSMVPILLFIHKKCLKWVYGSSRNYLDTVLTHKILPMAFRIQVDDCRLFILLNQGKLLRDCDNVEVLSLGVTRRRRNKFKVSSVK